MQTCDPGLSNCRRNGDVSMAVSKNTPHSPQAATPTRMESNSFGPIDVAADRYWGAQTERSRRNFRIGEEKMPQPLVRALAMVKKAAALANVELGLIDERFGQGHRGGSRRGDRRQARHAFPVARVADRLGHAIEHESERGDRQQGKRAPRRQARRQAPDPSQRSRQSRPVLQRHLPYRDAYRGGARARLPARTHRWRSSIRR